MFLLLFVLILFLFTVEIIYTLYIMIFLTNTNTNTNTDIKNEGYILLTNVLNENDLEFGLSSIVDNKVDYSIMKQYIDNVFFPKIKKTSNIISDPHYVKFRLSNNNNSTDASTFHGDIYNNTNSELLPIYTCLCYFDDAQLEIIPGSHKFNNIGSSIESYNKKITINIRRGDILIFHSNIHHRGINYNKTENRRLLQVFEVFPDKQTYEAHISKLIIVKTSDTFFMKRIINPLLYELSKNSTIVNNITMCHYILMYNDLHYKFALIDIAPYDKVNKYVSYEPGRRRLMEELYEKEELNVNIICDNRANYVSCSNYYLFFYLICFILILIVFYVIKQIRCGNYKLKKINKKLIKLNKK